MDNGNSISGIIAAAEKAIPQHEEDYEKDGLLYCGRCNTPKQTTIKIGETILNPYCLCRCESERMDAEKSEIERIQRDKHIADLRRTAFSEKMMEAWTFANDDNRIKKTTDIMRRYVDNFSNLRKKGKGLLLYGAVGTGKTFAACEVANALIDREIPCLVTNFASLSNRIQGFHDDKQEYIDSLSDYALLVIDDLGAERKSEYMQEMVYNIVDARYRSGLPMIITTNLSIEEIKSPENVQYSRIYDRIIQRCFPIKVDGKSRRRTAVREEYSEMKEILGI